MVATNPTTVKTSCTGHAHCATARARRFKSPSVFTAMYKDPCAVRVTSAITPVRTVYQSRMPLFVPAVPWFTRKLVHSGSKK